jgi:hypothetical protein
MMETRVIRYKTKVESADENLRLIEAVFAELAEKELAGIRYQVYRLDDGVSFVHIATLDSEKNPLQGSPAFGAFQSSLGSRLEEGPHPAVAKVVGTHGVN